MSNEKKSRRYFGDENDDFDDTRGEGNGAFVSIGGHDMEDDEKIAAGEGAGREWRLAPRGIRCYLCFRDASGCDLV